MSERTLQLIETGRDVEEPGWDVIAYDLVRADGTVLASIQSTPKDVLIIRTSDRSCFAVADEAPVRGEPFGASPKPGPFGITFSDHESSVTQTGYLYPSVRAAIEAAKSLYENGTWEALDVMYNRDAEGRRVPLYAVIDSAVSDPDPDTHATLVLATGKVSYWYEGAESA